MVLNLKLNCKKNSHTLTLCVFILLVFHCIVILLKHAQQTLSIKATKQLQQNNE